jgi:hypothetical protein
MKGAAAFASLACALVLIQAGHASACECVRLKPPSGGVRAEAPLIFEGQVMEIVDRSMHITRTTPSDSTGETRPLGREVSFQVTRAWAGVKSRHVTLFTDEGDCTFPFVAGHRYVVFAGRGAKGRPTTNICSRTSEADRAQEILKALGPSKQPRHH